MFKKIVLHISTVFIFSITDTVHCAAFQLLPCDFLKFTPKKLQAFLQEKTYTQKELNNVFLQVAYSNEFTTSLYEN